MDNLHALPLKTDVQVQKRAHGSHTAQQHRPYTQPCHPKLKNLNIWGDATTKVHSESGLHTQYEHVYHIFFCGRLAVATTATPERARVGATTTHMSSSAARQVVLLVYTQRGTARGNGSTEGKGVAKFRHTTARRTWVEFRNSVTCQNARKCSRRGGDEHCCPWEKDGERQMAFSLEC